MIGLVPEEPAGEDLASCEGLLLPFSAVGGVDLRPGVLFPDFLSSELSILALEEGRGSSGFLVTTLVSYGLNARCLLSGVERGLSCLLELGDERLITSLLTLFTFFLVNRRKQWLGRRRVYANLAACLRQKRKRAFLRVQRGRKRR